MTLIDLIANLTKADTNNTALQAELELWAGKALLKQGQLDQAQTQFENASQHTNDENIKTEIASQLILLAKAWERQGKTAENTTKAEAVLRRAAEIAPGQGLPALAQSLQRQKRSTEALAAWREVAKVNPSEANAYLNMARLYEQSGQSEQALAAYNEMATVAPSHKTYLILSQRLDELAPSLPAAPASRQIKIALLGNATLDHLQYYLKVECYRAGLRPEFYQGGFDQYTQEILNPQSGLYNFAPDVLILAVHASRLFPQLHNYPFDLSVEQRQRELENGLSTVQNLLDVFTARSSAMVLLHNMVVPQYPALSTFDWREEMGQTAAFNEINRRLAELARTRYKNVYILDEDKVQARTGKSRATDARLWFTARMGWSEAVLPELAHEYMRFITPYKAMGRKCIVLDLDNTLWGGVIGEDGMGGIQVGSDAPGNAFVAFQRELEKLWRRGILLAISSKNNTEDAEAVFEQHPGMALKLSHFAARRINWQPKEHNIKEIAKELNIGLDALVFIDDNPVERAKVRAELPQVLVPEWPSDPAQYRRALLELTVFDPLALTEEDRNRNKLYAEQKARQEFEEKLSTAGGSLDDYLANLEIVVEIDNCNSMTLARIAQLTGKTNQFNLTTIRRSEAQINELLAQGWQVYSLRVLDRFGDNGLTGVAMIEPKGTVWEVDTLLLSCRVMGRNVETSLLAYVAEVARQQGATRLQGWFIPTAKNAPAKEVYPQHGFKLIEQKEDGSQLWAFELNEQSITVPAWLTVKTPVLL